MIFWKKLLPVKKEEFKCNNCGALLFQSTFLKYDGLCALCAKNPEVARKRRLIAQQAAMQKRICGKCGITESRRHRELVESEKKGTFIYGKDWPTLLYCDNCNKFFCGGCQVDLGMDSGCPVCRKELD